MSVAFVVGMQIWKNSKAACHSQEMSPDSGIHKGAIAGTPLGHTSFGGAVLRLGREGERNTLPHFSPIAQSISRGARTRNTSIALWLEILHGSPSRREGSGPTVRSAETAV